MQKELNEQAFEGVIQESANKEAIQVEWTNDILITNPNISQWFMKLQKYTFNWYFK
jgi:hypothetical protein